MLKMSPRCQKKRKRTRLFDSDDTGGDTEEERDGLDFCHQREGQVHFFIIYSFTTNFLSMTVLH